MQRNYYLECQLDWRNALTIIRNAAFAVLPADNGAEIYHLDDGSSVRVNRLVGTAVFHRFGVAMDMIYINCEVDA